MKVLMATLLFIQMISIAATPHSAPSSFTTPLVKHTQLQDKKWRSGISQNLIGGETWELLEKRQGFWDKETYHGL